MSMLVPDITIAEKVMRSVSVYLFLLFALHGAVKPPMGHLAALDLVVPLGISNVLQSAAIGSHNPPGGGIVGASVIIELNRLVAWLTFHHKRLGITAMSEVRDAFLERAGHVGALPRRFVPA